MLKAYYDEAAQKVVVPTREQILTEAYNAGWHQAHDPVGYNPEQWSTDLTDRQVHKNWKIGLKEGEKARRLGVPT